MTVVPGPVALGGTVHVALSCTTNAAGQTVCANPSAGFLAGIGIFVFVYLAILVLGIIAAVKVVTKAGYSGWWILITFVPLVGAVFFFIFAFSTWPVTREVQMLRAQLAEPRSYGGRRSPVDEGPGPMRPTYGIPGFAGQDPAAPSPGGPAPLPTFGAFIAEGTVPVVTPPNVARPETTPAGLPPAGWYPDPGDAVGHLRYWDGTTWTDQVRSP